MFIISRDDQGNVFIRTDQLDGETDWKLRKAVKLVQTHIANGG
jgi:phospholipid-translocating ATPase